MYQQIEGFLDDTGAGWSSVVRKRALLYTVEREVVFRYQPPGFFVIIHHPICDFEGLGVGWVVLKRAVISGLELTHEKTREVA